MRRTNIFNYVQKSILVVFLAFFSQVIFAQYLKYDEKQADDFLDSQLQSYTEDTKNTDLQYYNNAKALRMVANNEAISQRLENNPSKIKQVVYMAFNYAIDCSPENLSNLFAQVVGVNLKIECESAYKVLENCLEDAYLVNEVAKQKYKRERPWYHYEIVDEQQKKELGKRLYGIYWGNIQSRFLNPENRYRSYPSGHSTVCYMAAYVFTKLFPRNEKQIMKLADNFALSRVIVGMHHKSDIEASEILAKKLFEEIQETDEYKKDFETAKKAVESQNFQMIDFNEFLK